jgi:hypothetical protein
MYLIVGYDEDGTRHTWNYCETMESAKAKMEEVIPAHAEMVEKYAEAIKRTKAIENDKDRDLEMSYWKMQGFFVKEFRIVDENVDR